MTLRVALCVNPTAGRGRAARAGAIVAEGLESAAVDVVLVAEPSVEAATRTLRAAVDSGVDAVVTVGGDGTVNLGVNAVAGTPVRLGVVAAGSGNDFARSLGLPVGDPAGAVQVIIDNLGSGVAREIDGVRWSGSGGSGWYGSVLGAGFDALVNERAARWRWPKGGTRYDLAVLRELPVFTPRHYVLELDGVRRELDAMLVAVANSPAYGGGLQICPDAQVDDGLLDVLLVSRLTRLQLVRLYPKVYSGGHVDHPAVEIVRARTVTVHAEGITGFADGERCAPLPLTCEVVPGALQVVGGPAGVGGVIGGAVGGAG